MGGKLSCSLTPEEMETLKMETGATESNIAELWHRFQKLDRHNKGTLGRDDFLAIPEFVMNPLADRITHLFFPPPRPHHHHNHHNHNHHHDDVNKNRISESEEMDVRIDFRQFVKTLAIFRPMTEKECKDSDDGADFINSKKEKLRFSFRMYDIDGNGEIQEGEIMEVLQMMLDDSIDKEHLRNIARRTLTEADKDGDAMITFEEFYKTLQHTDIDKTLSLRYFM